MIQYHDAKHFKCNDLRRWKVEFGKWFSVRLHHWVAGDPPAYQHTHPWDFVTIVLWGGYADVGEGRPTDWVNAPAIRYRRRTWRHSVTMVKPGTWSIVFTGRVVQAWRFWIDKEEVSQDEWALRPCD